jgi:tetratricopeptide (TPR) repeat protein
MILRRKPLSNNARVIAGVFFLCVLLQGCVTLVPQTAELRDRWPSDVPERVELIDAPFFPQRDYQCGPAALATALAYFKVPVTAETLVDQVYIPGLKGSLQVEMMAAARRYGMVSYELSPRFEDVLRELADGTPVVMLQNYGIGPLKLWHYATLVGYNADVGNLTLRSGTWRRWWMPLALFEFTWKDSGYWAMVALPPDHIPATADPVRYLQAVVALEQAGQPRPAATAYAAFLERWPDELGASIGLANAHYALGELAKAETALRRALEHHPDSVIALNNLAQTLSDEGRNTEALEIIERAAAAAGPHAAAVQQTRELILQRAQR